METGSCFCSELCDRVRQCLAPRLIWQALPPNLEMTTRTIAIERYMITLRTLRPRPDANDETAGRFSVDGAATTVEGFKFNL